MTIRATASLANSITRRLGPRVSLHPEDLRDRCDQATGGTLPPGELDRLSRMVERRLMAMRRLVSSEDGPRRFSPSAALGRVPDASPGARP